MLSQIYLTKNQGHRERDLSNNRDPVSNCDTNVGDATPGRFDGHPIILTALGQQSLSRGRAGGTRP